MSEKPTRRWRWWLLGAVVVLAAGAAVTYVYWPFGPGYSCGEPGHGKVDAGSYSEDKLEFRPTAVSPSGEYVAGMDKDFSEEEPATELYHLAKNGRSIWDGLTPAEANTQGLGTVTIAEVNDDGLMLLEAEDGGAWIIEDALYRQLNPPEGYDSVRIGDLGADGTVVGSASRAKDGDTEPPIEWEVIPVRWEPGQTTAEPLPLPEGLSGEATHILDDGRILGDLRDGDLWVDSDRADAWLWDGDREPAELSDIVEFAGRDGGKYTGKDFVLATACDWLLLKVKGGLMRTTLSGDGEAEFLTDVQHEVANYTGTGYGNYPPRIDGFGRVLGSPNKGGSGSTSAGIRDDGYTPLAGLDDRKAGNIVMGASDDGCVVAIWGDHRRSTMNCD